jgi:hypothetical protein
MYCGKLRVQFQVRDRVVALARKLQVRGLANLNDVSDSESDSEMEVDSQVSLL